MSSFWRMDKLRHFISIEFKTTVLPHTRLLFVVFSFYTYVNPVRVYTHVRPLPMSTSVSCPSLILQSLPSSPFSPSSPVQPIVSNPSWVFPSFFLHLESQLVATRGMTIKFILHSGCIDILFHQFTMFPHCLFADTTLPLLTLLVNLMVAITRSK